MQYTQSLQEQKACTDLVFAFLHKCWEQTGGASYGADPATFSLRPDPFYKRNDVLTPAVVEKVIYELENLMADEFKKYYTTHANWQGVVEGQKLVPTGFENLPYEQQLAIVQGVDEIMQPFRMPDIVATAGVDGQPQTIEAVNCPNCGVYCTCGS